jgi:hypothetical protein
MRSLGYPTVDELSKVKKRDDRVRLRRDIQDLRLEARWG